MFCHLLSLVPVQHAFTGRGKKSGFIAAGIAMFVIAAGQVGRMIEMRVLDPIVLVAGILPPLLFLAAITFINMKIGLLRIGGKILIASVALAAIAAPFVMKATSDKSFSSWLVEYIGSAMSSSGVGADGLNYAKAAVESAVRVIQSAFAAFILWIVAASWWLGSFYAARKALRETQAGESLMASIRLATMHVPPFALWPTLLSWALLFAALLTKQTGFVSAAAWNIALCLASLYAMQGIGIVSHLFKQFNANRLLRILAPLVIVAVALSSTAGAIHIDCTAHIGHYRGMASIPQPKRSLEMKIILNQDVPNLGEIGDVKEVAPGYARNFLLPRDLAVVYNTKTVLLFEKKKTEIDTIKEAKRKSSASLKEKIEAEDIVLGMPAGANGKLYGAVTNATVADELLKKGLEIDRKKIEVPRKVDKERRPL